MSDEYIADGKIHKIDSKYAYILEKLSRKDDFNLEKVYEIRLKFAEEYAKYLYETNHELCWELLKQKIMLYRDENYEFIYTPPHLASSLSMYGSYALKFIREKDDQQFME
jgi:hypothetical protein